MATSDPVLASLWDERDFELDCLGLNLRPLKLDNVHDELQNYLESVTSPTHDQDQLTEPKPDWGDLDDLAHREQIERDAGCPAKNHPMSVDTSEIHQLLSSLPRTVTDPTSCYSTSSSEGLFSSSLPSSLPEQSFCSASTTSLEPLWKRSQPPLSRSGSTSSLQSERGRPRDKDTHNVQRLHHRDSSALRQYIFDSNPTRSTSRASAASGRRGPLDIETHATMIAVKEVGACWRCKVMRRSVSCLFSTQET